ncbi:MAG: glucose-6-phosphate isomerase, partial [Bacteroidota bacterium]
MQTNTNPSQTQAWKALQAHFEDIKDTHMRDLFDQDPERYLKFAYCFKDLLVDTSKNRWTVETRDLLLQLADACNTQAAISAMFDGQAINKTEGRSVLHTALRNRSERSVIVKGKDVMPDVRRVLDQMKAFSTSILDGTWTGYTGKAIQHVVNIGIGGSDLGPYMASQALTPYHQPGIRVHYVSNIDGTHISGSICWMISEICVPSIFDT